MVGVTLLEVMLYSTTAFSDVHQLRVTITNITVRRLETEQENFGTTCSARNGRSSREALRESIGWPLNSDNTIRFDVFRLALLKIQVFCRVTLCRLLALSNTITFLLTSKNTPKHVIAHRNLNFSYIKRW
jgi:hypothetical protein